MTSRFPGRIDTERLTLRCYVHADAQAMSEVTAANLDHLRPFMAWAAFEPLSEADRIALIDRFAGQRERGEAVTYGMFESATGAYIGGTGVRSITDGVEIGYWIAASHEGRGLVTEAVLAQTLVAFATGAGVVEIHHEPANVRSGAVPRRLGFTHAGTFDLVPPLRTAPIPMEVWRATPAVLRESQWANAPRPALYADNGEPLEWPEP